MKETLILIPGVGSNHVLWEHQTYHLEDLIDAKVEILSHSGRRAELVNRLLREAPEQFALAGHSFGGWVAQAVAAEAPERVSKLMLCNTWSRHNEAHIAMLHDWLKYIEKNMLIETLDEGVPYIIHSQKLQNRKFVSTLKSMQHEFPAEGYRHQFQAMINDYDTTDLLPKISCPTLVVHAREDLVFSLDEHQYMAENIRGGKCTIIEDCGHMSPMEQPQAITALMRLWLNL